MIFDILKKTDKLHFYAQTLAYSKFLLYLCSVKGKTKGDLLCKQPLINTNE